VITNSKFSPSWWLSNPHLQTIFASKLRRPVKLQLCKERITLPDNDFVDIASSYKRDGPLVCIFHGLAGCIDSAYANGLIATLENSKFRAVFMHFRGCSGEPNRLAKTYHSGHTDDIRFLINKLHAENPHRPIHAVGFSLGANALLKYLGEEQGASPLESAITVSPPLVLAEAATRMNRGLSRGYQWYLINLMRAQHQAKQRIYPELTLPSAKSLKTFWEFDDAITARLNGFADVHDYYARSSSRPWLSDIKVQTQIIFSRDDPFFSPAVIPTADELSDAVTLELSDRGGHVGFVEGNNPFKLSYWLDRRILALLETTDAE